MTAEEGGGGGGCGVGGGGGVVWCFFFFNDTATTEIYTLSLHDALPIYIRTVAEMISSLKLNERMLYIQVNEQTIKKEEYGTKMLKENDHIDIISAVGGG